MLQKWLCLFYSNTKTEEMHNNLSVIAICVAKLYV